MYHIISHVTASKKKYWNFTWPCVEMLSWFQLLRRSRDHKNTVPLFGRDQTTLQKWTLVHGVFLITFCLYFLGKLNECFMSGICFWFGYFVSISFRHCLVFVDIYGTVILSVASGSSTPTPRTSVYLNWFIKSNKWYFNM